MGMHFLAKNSLCTFKNQQAVILSPISYHKVLIQTINKEREEVNTRRLLSLPNNEIISLKLEENMSIAEVHEEMLKVYGQYSKLCPNETDSEVSKLSDFERFKVNIRKNIE